MIFTVLEAWKVGMYHMLSQALLSQLPYCLFLLLGRLVVILFKISSSLINKACHVGLVKKGVLAVFLVT
jgi:hypothetical protein